MPWYPFFQKMEVADVFIVLTHCQFEKNGYQNRFFFQGKWRTMSVRGGLEQIASKQYIDPSRDWQRIKDSLPLYRRILDRFDDCVTCTSLAETNDAILRRIADFLGVQTRIVRDEQLSETATQRLISLCKSAGADEYLSGLSGRKYLDLNAFKEAGIRIVFQDEAKMLKLPILEILKERL